MKSRRKVRGSDQPVNGQRLRSGILAVLALFLLALLVRLALPSLVTGYVNRALDHLPHYRGSIASIDLALYRSAYTIRGLDLRKITADSDIPFLRIESVDISVEWRALLRGTIVSEIDVLRPDLNLVKENHTEGREPDQRDIQSLLDDLVPFDINRFTVRDGVIAYREIGVQPQINISLTQIELVAENVSNIVDKRGSLDARLRLSAQTVGSGTLQLQGRGNMLKTVPDVDLSLSLEGVAVQALSSFAEHYAGVAMRRGRLAVYSELAMADGSLVGYVKPILTDAEFVRADDTIPATLWEGFVSFFALVLENQSKDSIATKVPFSGEVTSIDPEELTGVVNIVRNAWIDAFQRTVDGEINFLDAGGGASGA